MKVGNADNPLTTSENTTDRLVLVRNHQTTCLFSVTTFIGVLNLVMSTIYVANPATRVMLNDQIH